MDISVNAHLERIENGFIVEVDGKKSFYRTITEFIDLKIREDIANMDQMIREHYSYGDKYTLSFALNDIDDNQLEQEQ